MVSRLISSGGAAFLALLTLACGSTSVTQSTAPDSARCQASVGAVPTIPAAGGRVEVSVLTQRECAWTAASNSSWIQLSPTSGQGETAITLTATANPQGLARNGNIAVNGAQVAISQAPSPCTYSFSPTDVTVPAAGGSTGTRITTLVGCNWTASSPVDWAVVQTRTGSGTGQVEVAVDRNTSPTTRSVDVVIASRNFTITQPGTPAVPAPHPGAPTAPTPGPGPAPGPAAPPAPAPSNPCTYQIDPLIRFVRDRGSDQEVRVTTASTCNWTATATVDWLRVRNSQGTGTRDVRYEVERNRTGRVRTGAITIAGLTHQVVQEAGDDDD